MQLSGRKGPMGKGSEGIRVGAQRHLSGHAFCALLIDLSASYVSPAPPPLKYLVVDSGRSSLLSPAHASELPQAASLVTVTEC